MLRRLMLPLLLTVSSLAVAAEGDWKLYADKDEVQSFSRALPDTRVLAMRGVTTIPLHISTVVGAYLDDSIATEWVDMLVRYDGHPIEGTANAIERQIYDMPWPVADREFVWKRTVVFDAARKTVKVSYQSIEDARYPVTEDYVRATDFGSSFTFTALPDGKTKVDAVAMVNPEGSLPLWLFNSVQKGWPRESLTGLRRVSSAPGAKVWDDIKGW